MFTNFIYKLFLLLSLVSNKLGGKYAMTTTATPPAPGRWRRRGARFLRYFVIPAGAYFLGTCSGSCAGEPDRVTAVDVDGDNAKDLVVEDRGYVWGLFGSEYHPMIQEDGEFERISEDELVERILKARKG